MMSRCLQPCQLALLTKMNLLENTTCTIQPLFLQLHWYTTDSLPEVVIKENQKNVMVAGKPCFFVTIAQKYYIIGITNIVHYHKHSTIYGKVINNSTCSGA